MQSEPPVKGLYRSLPKVSDKYKGLKISALQADDTACAFYRIINPLTYLEAHGAQVSITYKSINLALLMQSDFIIIPRAYDADLLEVMNAIQWAGKALIYEIDDDLHHVRPTNPAITVFNKDNGSLPIIDEYLEQCWGAWVTTPYLAKNYSNQCQNLAILDNYIDFSLRDWACDVEWTPAGAKFKVHPIEKDPELKDKFVIGYSGGTSHMEDLRSLRNELGRFLKEHSDAVLVTCLPEPLVQQLIREQEVPSNQVVRRPVREFSQHPPALRGVDVQLCPIMLNRFNLGKCVVGNTRVHTPKGSFRIQDLCDIRKEDTFTPLEIPVYTEEGVAKSEHFYYAGLQQTVKLITKHGLVVEGTLTHRIKDSNNEWKYLSDFHLGDKIKVQTFQHPTNLDYVKVPYMWTCIRKDSKIVTLSNPSSLPEITIDETWGELLGFILGDGHVSKTGHISICVSGNDIDIVPRIENLFRNIGIEPVTKSAGSRNMRYVNVCSKPLVEFLYSLGIVANKKKAQESLRVPEVIWRSRKSVIARFLSALIESDGHASKDSAPAFLSSCSHTLMQDIHTLLLGFGIFASVSPRTASCQSGRFTYSTISMGRRNCEIFEKEIGFISERKSGRLRDNLVKAASNACLEIATEDTVIGITHGEAEVFDISVPLGENWFGNGFVQHNSALKIKENMASGAAVIASCIGPYAHFHYESGGKFLLVGDNRFSEPSWKSALEKLYKDRENLENLKRAGREYIISEHSLEKNFHKWADSLMQIRARVHAGIIGPPDERKPDTYFKRIDPKRGLCPITGKKYKEGYYGAFG